MPYKFNLEKYGNVAKEDAMKCKRIYDGRDVYVDAAGTFWCDGVRVERDMCDFIPDAPQESTFMVFNRDVYLKAGGTCPDSSWAMENYGKIMEFLPGNDIARRGKYGFERSWCRPLTLDDFKREKIAVAFKSEADQQRFLQECEKAGIRMDPRDADVISRVEFSPGRQFSVQRSSGGCISWLTYPLTYGECTIVPFTSFSFPFEAPKPIPSRSIHITSDGLTTHAVMKEGEKVVKRSKATCSPTDQYDFQTGAEMALERLFPASKAVPPAPQLYMEIERKAKVGEKIKIVSPHMNGAFDYKLGDVLDVVRPRCELFNSVQCAWDGERLRCVNHDEYLVLLPVRRVHRRAMPGEWIIPTRKDSPFYTAGNLYKAQRPKWENDVWIDSEKTGTIACILDKNYDVLEGYEEGAKWPEK